MANNKTYLITSTKYKVDTDSLTEEIRNSNITIALDYINTDIENIYIYFKTELSLENEVLLDTIISNHEGVETKPIQNLYDAFGNLMTSTVGIAGLKETYISFNWCDKTTWWQNSIRVVDEVLVNSGDHKTYNMDVPKIVIDVTHWKISDEGIKINIMACKPVVKVNGSTLNSGTPWTEAYYIGNTLVDADYVIDYNTGSLTFTNQLDINDVVTLSYNKLPETDTNNPWGTRQSSWIIKAPEGCRVLLNRAEAQFSEDVRLRDTIRFVAYSTVGLDPALDFLKQAPFYYPNGTEVPLPALNPELEKQFITLEDYIDDADGCYLVPVTPLSGRTIRDISQSKIVFRWHYEGNENMEVNSAKGRYIRVFLKDDVNFTGSRCTSTLYGTRFLL